MAGPGCIGNSAAAAPGSAHPGGRGGVFAALDPFPPAPGVEPGGESALKFDLLAWIEDPPRQFFIRSDLNFSIIKSFRQKGIRIPFPQRELHFHASGDRPETDPDSPPGHSASTG